MVFVGYLLSPLSWWNDAFVNVPLALALAWLISWFVPSLFGASFVAGYWLTNIAGLVLIHHGGATWAGAEATRFTARDWLKYLLVSVGYTLLIVALLWLRVLEPLPAYLPAK